jgi:hypothetical protein
LAKKGCLFINKAYELWANEVLNFKYELYDPNKPLDICQKIDKILIDDFNSSNERSADEENWIEDCLKDINLTKRISDNEKSIMITPNAFEGSKLSTNIKVIPINFINFSTNFNTASLLLKNKPIFLFILSTLTRLQSNLI